VEERLDRLCVDVEWVALFPTCKVSHIDKKVSGHLPIVINTKPGLAGGKTAKRRHFKMMWITDERCDKVVRRHGMLKIRLIL